MTDKYTLRNFEPENMNIAVNAYSKYIIFHIGDRIFKATPEKLINILLNMGFEEKK